MGVWDVSSERLPGGIFYPSPAYLAHLTSMPTSEMRPIAEVSPILRVSASGEVRVLARVRGRLLGATAGMCGVVFAEVIGGRVCVSCVCRGAKRRMCLPGYVSMASMAADRSGKTIAVVGANANGRCAVTWVEADRGGHLWVFERESTGRHAVVAVSPGGRYALFQGFSPVLDVRSTGKRVRIPIKFASSVVFGAKSMLITMGCLSVGPSGGISRVTAVVFDYRGAVLWRCDGLHGRVFHASPTVGRIAYVDAETGHAIVVVVPSGCIVDCGGQYLDVAPIDDKNIVLVEESGSVVPVAVDIPSAVDRTSPGELQIRPASSATFRATICR